LGRRRRSTALAFDCTPTKGKNIAHKVRSYRCRRSAALRLGWNQEHRARARSYRGEASRAIGEPRRRTPSMTPESIMELGQHALYVAMLVAAPLLLTALAVGLLIGVIQAATQINEMTLSFIPKLIAMALVALVAGPWMLRLLVQFTTQLIESLPGAIR